MRDKRPIQNYRDLDVYKESFRFQQSVFRLSQIFPKDERYSLTDQFRRSSRSIGANLAEAWAKRRYAAHFLSKLTDPDGELQESEHWLRTAVACEYLQRPDGAVLMRQARKIGKMLGSMMANNNTFCATPDSPT